MWVPDKHVSIYPDRANGFYNVMAFAAVQVYVKLRTLLRFTKKYEDQLHFGSIL